MVHMVSLPYCATVTSRRSVSGRERAHGLKHGPHHLQPPAAQGGARADPMAEPFGAKGLVRKYAANRRGAIRKAELGTQVPLAGLQRATSRSSVSASYSSTSSEAFGARLPHVAKASDRATTERKVARLLRAYLSNVTAQQSRVVKLNAGIEASARRDKKQRRSNLQKSANALRGR